jgi:SAM-dependent methyltransferase
MPAAASAQSPRIARAVAPAKVVGLDRDPENVAAAREQHGAIPNLSFEPGDALSLPFDGAFDIVNAARTLQWISDPALALANMKRAAKRGGRVVVLDYNLADNRWEPALPDEFASFYRAFLDWRTANHWDNHMAEHLPDLFRACGFDDIEVHVSDQTVARGDGGFEEKAGIWSYVTEVLGPQIAKAGFFEEDKVNDAERAYLDFVAWGLTRQTLIMRTVEGVVPRL